MEQNQNPFAPSNNVPTPSDDPFESFVNPPAAQSVPVNDYTGNAYIPPITPDERRNTTVPNYVPNIAPSYDAEEPMSVGDWMVTMLIMMIPCVNIVMLFVWAFGSGNKSRANYFKATLIWAAIGIGLSILISIACLFLGVSLADTIFDMYT